MPFLFPVRSPGSTGSLSDQQDKFNPDLIPVQSNSTPNPNQVSPQGSSQAHEGLISLNTRAPSPHPEHRSCRFFNCNRKMIEIPCPSLQTPLPFLTVPSSRNSGATHFKKINQKNPILFRMTFPFQIAQDLHFVYESAIHSAVINIQDCPERPHPFGSSPIQAVNFSLILQAYLFCY